MAYTIEDVKKVIVHCADAVIANRDELEKIDSQSGDGDLGISMQKGCQILKDVVAEFSGDEIGKLLMKCAMAYNKAAPSTMGTLICSGFMRLSKELATTGIDEQKVYDIPRCFADAIMASGKAQEGDRTILDALLPACRALESAKTEGKSLTEAFLMASDEAAKGAAKTKDMVPKIGRAKWVPDNAAGIIDGGARLCDIVLKSITSI